MAEIVLSKLAVDKGLTPWQALDALTSNYRKYRDHYVIHYKNKVYKLRIDKVDQLQDTPPDNQQRLDEYVLTLTTPQPTKAWPSMMMTVKTPNQTFIAVEFERVGILSNHIVGFSIALAKKLGAKHLLLDRKHEAHQATIVSKGLRPDWLDMMLDKPTYYQQFGFEYNQNNQNNQNKLKKAKVLAAMHAKLCMQHYVNLLKKYQAVAAKVIEDPRGWCYNNHPIGKARLAKLRAQFAELPYFIKMLSKYKNLAQLAKRLPSMALLIGAAPKVVLSKSGQHKPAAWFGGFGLVAKFAKLLPDSMCLVLN